MKNTIRAGAAVGAAILLATLAACDREPKAKAAAAPQASEQTVNVPAAAPTGDPAGTTPVTGKQSEISKQAETTQMPQEGDNQAYSTVSPVAPQKAGGVDPIQTSPERRQQ
ncbi:MAG TPA: hypothetical protein VHQ02_15235 [Usitatibacter sp.]|jgi:hypothetical protein|nr:hypothetical protein [Usitatibacter sp.]